MSPEQRARNCRWLAGSRPRHVAPATAFPRPMHRIARLLRHAFPLIALLIALYALPRTWTPGRSSPQRQKIPRLLHVSWKSEKLPERFKRWNDAAKENLPGWRHQLHTDGDNRRLVETRFPDLLDLYSAFPYEIMRADFARLAYMSAFGGVYTDLDVELIAKLGDLDLALATLGTPGGCRPKSHRNLEGGSKCRRELVLALHGAPGNLTGWPHSLPNAFMASVPGHPFWRFAMEKVNQKWNEKLDQVSRNLSRAVNLTDPVFRRTLLRTLGPEYITGPGLLRDALLDYVSHDPSRATGIVLLGPELIYGYNWQENHELDETCSAQRNGFNRTRCVESVAVGSTSPTGRKFKWPKLVELRVQRSWFKRVWRKQGDIVPVELIESKPTITGTLGISYWSHSWGHQIPDEVQGAG